MRSLHILSDCFLPAVPRLFPKDPFAPKASHVMLPAFLNDLLIGLLKFEAWMMGAIVALGYLYRGAGPKSARG